MLKVTVQRAMITEGTQYSKVQVCQFTSGPGTTNVIITFDCCLPRSRGEARRGGFGSVR
jgi:hypothetical protein